MIAKSISGNVAEVIYDEAFFESSERLSAFNCMHKKTSSYIVQSIQEWTE